MVPASYLAKPLLPGLLFYFGPYRGDFGVGNMYLTANLEIKPRLDGFPNATEVLACVQVSSRQVAFLVEGGSVWLIGEEGTRSVELPNIEMRAYDPESRMPDPRLVWTFGLNRMYCVGDRLVVSHRYRFAGPADSAFVYVLVLELPTLSVLGRKYVRAKGPPPGGRSLRAWDSGEGSLLMDDARLRFEGLSGEGRLLPEAVLEAFARGDRLRSRATAS